MRLDDLVSQKVLVESFGDSAEKKDVQVKPEPVQQDSSIKVGVRLDELAPKRNLIDASSLLPKEVESKGFEIRMPEEKTFGSKIKSRFSQAFEPSVAKSQVIFQLSKSLNVPIDEVQNNFDSIARDFARDSGLATVPTAEEFLTMSALGVSAVAAPTLGVFQIAKGIGSFLLAKEGSERVVLPVAKMTYDLLWGDEVKYETQRLADLMPEGFRDAGVLAEFIIYGAAANKLIKNIINPLLARPETQLAGQELLRNAYTTRQAVLNRLGIKKSGNSPLTEQEFSNALKISRLKKEIKAKQQASSFKETNAEIYQKHYSSPQNLKSSILKLMDEGKILKMSDGEVNALVTQIYNSMGKIVASGKASGVFPRILTPERLLGARQDGKLTGKEFSQDRRVVAQEYRKEVRDATALINKLKLEQKTSGNKEISEQLKLAIELKNSYQKMLNAMAGKFSKETGEELIDDEFKAESRDVDTSEFIDGDMADNIIAFDRIDPAVLVEGADPSSPLFEKVAFIEGKPAIRKSGVYADKYFESNGVDVGGFTDNIISFATAFDNISARDATKSGFGEMTKSMSKYLQQLEKRESMSSNVANEINNILKRNGLYSFGYPSEADGKIIYEVMEGKEPNFVQEKHKVAAKEIRMVLDNLRESANKVRALLGKELIGFIENYAPHVEKYSLLQQLFKEQDTIGSLTDFITPDEKLNPRAKQRLGEMSEELKEKNIYKLLDGYIRGMMNDVYLSPIIEHIKAIIPVLEARGMRKAPRYLRSFIKENLVGQTTNIDEVFHLTRGSTPRWLVQKIVGARGLGALTGNLNWIFNVLPSSIALTAAEVGVARTIGSTFEWFLNPEMRNEISKYTNLLLKSESTVGVTKAGDLDNIHKRVMKNPVSDFNNFISMLSGAFEFHITGLSALAGLRHGQSLGLKGEDLNIYANYIASTTQSMYNPELRPQALNPLMMRFMFPFHTFLFEAWRHLKTITAKGGGLPLDKKDRLFKFMRLIAATFLINEITKKTMGRPVYTFGSFVPMAGSAVDMTTATMINALRKRFKGIDKDYLFFLASQHSNIPGRTGTIAPVSDAVLLTQAFKNILDHDNYDKMRELMTFWGMGFAGVGGAVQVNRFVDALISAENGWKRNVKGDKMFKIRGADKYKAMIFGTHATGAGKEYWNKKKGKSSKNKSKSLSEMVGS